MAAAAVKDPMILAGRRTSSFKPSTWTHDFVESLKSDFAGEIYNKRANKLEEYVRVMFDKTNNRSSSSLLNLINTIQRLGVSYHFNDEIKGALDTIMMSMEDKSASHESEGLFTRALRFRLFRQHGYEVSQDVFKRFHEEMKSGDLKPCIVEDIEGMLSLYEASFYAFEGEEILDQVQEFIASLLKEYLNNEGINSTTSPQHLCSKRLVSHALDFPLHLRVPRIEARWFIDTYEMMQDDMDPQLLEFAKLDFNMLQATYQHELKCTSRWWKDLGFTNTLLNTRERWMENHFWTVGYNFQPKFGYYRIEMAKQIALITAIDDIYDIYGSLDELEQFTDAVERWDKNIIGELPDFMKGYILALYDTTNEIANEILKKHGLDVMLYLKTSWAGICKSFLVEAKWYYNGYIPTLEEYLNNGWISISGTILPTLNYILLEDEITVEGLEFLKNYSPDLIRWSFTITRLLNDLSTSPEEIERGDVTKSIQCYMHHTGASVSAGREHVKHLIKDLWKKINKEQYSPSIFPRSFVDSILDITRIGNFFYHYGDGHGVPDGKTKEAIMSIFIEPIPLEDNIQI